VRLNDQVLVVLGHVMDLSLPDALIQDDLEDFLVFGEGLFREENLGDGSSDRFLAGPAVNMLGALVPEEDVGFEVADDDGVSGDVDERGLLSDLFEGELALGDIALDAKGSDDVPIFVS